MSVILITVFGLLHFETIKSCMLGFPLILMAIAFIIHSVDGHPMVCEFSMVDGFVGLWLVKRIV